MSDNQHSEMAHGDTIRHGNEPWRRPHSSHTTVCHVGPAAPSGLFCGTATILSSFLLTALYRSKYATIGFGAGLETCHNTVSATSDNIYIVSCLLPDSASEGGKRSMDRDDRKFKTHMDLQQAVPVCLRVALCEFPGSNVAINQNPVIMLHPDMSPLSPRIEREIALLDRVPTAPVPNKYLPPAGRLQIWPWRKPLVRGAIQRSRAERECHARQGLCIHRSGGGEGRKKTPGVLEVHMTLPALEACTTSARAGANPAPRSI